MEMTDTTVRGAPLDGRRLGQALTERESTTMPGLEEIEFEMARERHAERIREAYLERALAVSTVNADYAAGIGASIVIGIVTSSVRAWFRWLTTPRQRPAGAAR